MGAHVRLGFVFRVVYLGFFLAVFYGYQSRFPEGEFSLNRKRILSKWPRVMKNVMGFVNFFGILEILRDFYFIDFEVV